MRNIDRAFSAAQNIILPFNINRVLIVAISVPEVVGASSCLTLIFGFEICLEIRKILDAIEKLKLVSIICKNLRIWPGNPKHHER